MTCLINLLSWLPGHSGFGSYVKRVVPQVSGLRLQLDADGSPTLLSESAWTTSPPGWSPSRRLRFLQRYSLVQHGVDLSLLLSGFGLSDSNIDVIYSPFFDALFEFPSTPQLITCHDLTPLIVSNSRKAWFRYRFWQPRHCRAATRLIAISQHVADQLVAFGLKSADIEVIPNGIAISRPKVTAPQSQDLLVLARHDKNKNLEALLKGVAVLQQKKSAWNGVLRIIGRPGSETKALQRLCQSLPDPNQVQWISHVSQETLIALLRTSMALISASIEEGFDYPVLESKAEGIPTIISDIPVHREFHDGSSLFFSPHDDGTTFAQCTETLTGDLPLWLQLSDMGYGVASCYSLERQASHIQSQIDFLAR